MLLILHMTGGRNADLGRLDIMTNVLLNVFGPEDCKL